MLTSALNNAISPVRPLRWSEAFLLSGVVLAALVPALAGAYLAKSALGINLLPGPSPLHDLLYHLVV